MNILSGALTFDYDASSDVLYAFVGESHGNCGMDTEEGVILRVDSTTHQIVGFTIVNYHAKLRSGILKTIPGFGQIDLPVPNVNGHI